MKRAGIVSIFVLLTSSFAFAQSGAPVKQSGNVTPGQVPWWLTSGVIGGGVSSADSPVTSFGVTNNGGNGICVNSDRNTAAGRNTLCLGASTTGPATITLQNYGTASPQSLEFIVNGTIIPSVTACTSLGAFSVGTGSSAQCSNAAGSRAILNGGPLTINTTNTSANALMVTQLGQTGSVVGPLFYNNFQITTPTVVTSSGSRHFGWPSDETTGFLVEMYGATGASRTLSAGRFQIVATQVGGAPGDTNGLEAGAYANVAVGSLLTGLVSASILDTGGSATLGIEGSEHNVGMAAGATAPYRFGVAIGAVGAGQGSSLDAAIGVNHYNIFGSTGAFQNLIALTNNGGLPPLSTTANLFTADTAYTVANIFNLSNMTVTGNILSFPNVTLTGAGAFSTGGVIKETINQNSATTTVVQNNSAGTNASAVFVALNGTDTGGGGTFGVGGTGYTTIPLFQNRAILVGNNLSSGIVIDASGASNPIIFALNDNEVGRWDSTGFNVDGVIRETINQNAGTIALVQNNNAGTGALSAFVALNNNGTGGGGTFGVTSTGYTGTALLQNRVVMVAGSLSSGIVIDAAGASNPIIFAINDIEIGRWDGATPGLLNAAVAFSVGGTVGQAAKTCGATIVVKGGIITSC